MEMSNVFGLSPIDTILAKIQSRVAEFLQDREILVTIISNTQDLQIKEGATALLQVQSDLESRLSDALKTVDLIKSDAYTMSDVLSVGSFYASMEKHISDVNDLRDKNVGTPQSAGMSGFEMLILSVIAGGIVYGITKRRG